VEESQLQDLAAKGLLQPRAVVHWRAPPVEHEELLPEPGEIMSFLTFHERGPEYPAHPLLLSLLNNFEVELQHLNEWGAAYCGLRHTLRGLPQDRSTRESIPSLLPRPRPGGEWGSKARTGRRLQFAKESLLVGGLPDVHPCGFEPGVARGVVLH
jgi:hypothetical protein